MKKWFKLSVICLLVSCQTRQDDVVRYINGKQLLNMNTLSRNGRLIDKVDLATIAPDTVVEGEELYAQIYLKDTHYKIADAFYNCNVSEQSLADTLSKRIEGCKDGLIVENDTVEIYFTVGNSKGWKQFHDITVLSVDSERVYRFHKGTFKYFVK